MSEAEKAPRFPFAAAALCAACVGVAGWTWMRYSYAWEITPATTCGLRDGLYVVLRGDFVEGERRHCTLGSGIHFVRWLPSANTNAPILIACEGWGATLPQRTAVVYGRAHNTDPNVGPVGFPVLDDACPFTVEVAASRLHPASVTGLAVGAMGVVVFAVYLLGWLRERRSAA